MPSPPFECSGQPVCASGARAACREVACELLRRGEVELVEVQIDTSEVDSRGGLAALEARIPPWFHANGHKGAWCFGAFSGYITLVTHWDIAPSYQVRAVHVFPGRP